MLIIFTDPVKAKTDLRFNLLHFPPAAAAG